MGGYATGTLTEAERKLLFEAALEDQELFDELAAEQSLKELVETPGVRSRLAAALEPAAAEARRAWWASRWSWAGAAALAGVAIVAVVLPRSPKPVEIAAVRGPAEGFVKTAVPPAAPEVAQVRSQLETAAQGPVRAASRTPVPEERAPAAVSRDQESDGRAVEAEKKEEAPALDSAAAPAPARQLQPQAPAPAIQQTQSPVQFAGTQQTQALVQLQREEIQAAQQGAVSARTQLLPTDEVADQRKDQIPAQTVRVEGQAGEQVAGGALARTAAVAMSRAAFRYAVEGSVLRFTPLMDGVLQMTVRLPNQAVASPGRRLARGPAVDLPIPAGARAIVLSFSSAGAASGGGGAATPKVGRSGVVEFPAGTQSVAVEIGLE
jgi:hypothetical protein